MEYWKIQVSPYWLQYSNTPVLHCSSTIIIEARLMQTSSQNIYSTDESRFTIRLGVTPPMDIYLI